MICPHIGFILRAAALLAVMVVPGYGEDPRPAVPEVVISDTAALKAQVGKTVSVTGKVNRVGMSKSGFIVFINFEGVPPGGFTAIVKSACLPEIERAAGANLDAALPGRHVAVSGTVSLYKETPQIEIKTADQIKVAR